MVQPLVPSEKRQTMSAAELKKALKKGQTDFTGVDFLDAVEIREKHKNGDGERRDWSFRRAVFHQPVAIVGLKAGVLNFECASFKRGGVIRAFNIEEGNFLSLRLKRKTLIFNPEMVRFNLYLSFRDKRMRRLIETNDRKVEKMVVGMRHAEDVRAYHKAVPV